MPLVAARFAPMRPERMAIHRIGSRIAMGVLRRTLGEISSVSSSMSGW